MKRTAVLAVCFAVTTAAAVAAPPAWVPAASPAYATCMAHGEAAQCQTRAIEACGDAEIALQQHRLDAVYAAKLARLSPAASVSLRNGQRMWAIKRESACPSAAEKDAGGTLQLARDYPVPANPVSRVRVRVP
jgi:uncharacterized protein YecT (DUF1311 family)